MFTYKKVLCDILECTEYEYKSNMCSTLSDSKGTVISECGFGSSNYTGKTIQEKVPFIEVDEPFHYLYIPENKFNFITTFLIGFHSKFHHGITLDNKRFYNTGPNKLHDIYVKVCDEN